MQGLDSLTRVPSSGIADGIFNVRDYGAMGDGVTDDTTAIVAALADALAAYGTLYFPAGDYLISGSGAEILLVTKGITIRGESMNTRLIVKSTTGSSTDIIHYKPPVADVFTLYPGNRDNRNFVLKDISIYPESGTPGRYPLHIEAQSGSYIHEFRVSNVHLGHLGAAASIYLNNTAGNANGIFTSTIDKCILEDGIKGVLVGDTIDVGPGNNIRGNNYAVDSTFASGVTTFNIIGNNITSDKGIHLNAIVKPNIAFNIIELFRSGASTPGSNGACIDLEGVQGATINDNHIGSVSGATLNGIRLGTGTFATTITNNTGTLPTGNVLIKPVVTGTSTFYWHNYVQGGGTEIDTSVDSSGFKLAAIFDVTDPAAAQAGAIAVVNAVFDNLKLTGIVFAAADRTQQHADTLVAIDTTTGAKTYTLIPIAANALNGRLLAVINTGGANALTIAPGSGNIILGGGPNLVLAGGAPHAAILWGDQANAIWWVIAKY